MKTLFQWLSKILLCLGFVFFLLGTQPAQCATPIESGETICESLGVGEMDAYTFYGEAGDRVRITAVLTGGQYGFNTELVLIDPDFEDAANTQPGGDLLDYVLQKTGTYTVIVQEDGFDQSGSYCITLLNVTRGPMTSSGDPDGGAMASGETHIASLPVSDMDAYQFYGEAGDRVRITAVLTGGQYGFNTELVLIDPDFEDAVNTQPGGDLLDYVLQKTGTYTVIVQEAGFNESGNYNITLLNLTHGPMDSLDDPDGGAMASGETHIASLPVSDMDAYQFYGEAGDRVRITAVLTGGQYGFNTELVLIDPDFEDAVNTQPGGDLLDYVLQKTGTYTVIVQEAGFNESGNYNITLLNLTHGPMDSLDDPDGGPMASGETHIASLPVSDMDAYQFYGEAGDRVRITAVLTGGQYGFNTELVLVDPDFEDAVNTQPGGDLLDYVLQKTGIYIVIVQEAGFNQSGTYNITLLNFARALSSSRDADGGLLVPGDLESASLPVSDMDGYQFYGEAGDLVRITAALTGGQYSFNTDLMLIDPDLEDEAFPDEPCGDLINHFLLKSGLYTIVVQECNFNQSGTYNLSFIKLPDTLRPGIYNPSPSSICGQPTNVMLVWDEVTDASDYDVFFGPNVIEPLQKVGNVTSPNFPLADLDCSTIYYWTVVAHTTTGEILGTVNWFGTRFIGDFDEDGDVDGSDLAVFAADFGKTDCGVPTTCPGDFDNDGDVDGSDLAVFAADFGRTDCP